MIVPKGKSFEVNRIFKPGDDVPDSLIPERVKKEWSAVPGKDKPKTFKPTEKPELKK